MQISDNLIIYDALSITSKIHEFSDFIEILGMRECPWKQTYGAKGFSFRLYYESISIHFCRDDGVVWLEMTGQGCRAFETYGTGDYEALFQMVLDNPDDMNITRLDIAYDDHTGVLDMQTLYADVRMQNFVTKFRQCEIREGWLIGEGSNGGSCNFGSDKSETYLRIYDKALERGYTDGRHWIRVEFQLRRKRALQFIMTPGLLGEKFSGVLLNYLRFVVPQNDENKSRWPLTSYWNDLCGSAIALSIYEKPGVDYNMLQMTHYVFQQAGNAIDATIQILGIDGFLEELKSRTIMPNPKYTKIVEKAERGEL